MKNRTTFRCLIAAALTTAASAAGAQQWRGDANLLLAGKHMDEDQWRPTDRLGEIGVETTWGRTEWPVGVAADALFASREEPIFRDGFTQQRARTTELDLGARKVWRPSALVRPYLGGGLSLTTAELQYSGPDGTVSDSDSGAGLWLGGGVFWTLGSAFNLGVDARATAAGVTLFGGHKNAGGFHLGVLAGYHWGG